MNGQTVANAKFRQGPLLERQIKTVAGRTADVVYLLRTIGILRAYPKWKTAPRRAGLEQSVKDPGVDVGPLRAGPLGQSDDRRD